MSTRAPDVPAGDGIDVDTAAVEARLAAALSPGAGPETLAPVRWRRLSGGQSNPTYGLSTAAGAFVLRRKPFGPLLPSAHAIEREWRVMDALAPTPVPVPAVVLTEPEEGVIGAPFYVMRHVEGRVIHDTRMPGAAPAERRATMEALVDLLADLHAVDVAAAGLGDFGRSGGYVARQVARWSKQYRATETARIEAMERLAAALPDAVAALPDETTLVHGDFRLDNAILAPDRPVPVALIDWELSTLGHPLADLAYFLMPWGFPRDLRWGLAEDDLAALGIPDAGALAARYAARTGRDAAPWLDLLLAYNCFRMAAILQGVHARALAGNAADPDAAAHGRDVPRLAAVALAHAGRAGIV